MTTAGSVWRSAAAALAFAVALMSAAPADPAHAQSAGSAPDAIKDVNKALEHQRTGVPYRWSNPRTGQSGTITVARTYRRGATPCRDYERTTERGGRLVTSVSGTGCRVSAGVWSLVEQPPRRFADAPPAGKSPAPRRPAPRAADTLSAAATPDPDFQPVAPRPKPNVIYATLPTPAGQ